jgi:hypothetical protein
MVEKSFVFKLENNHINTKTTMTVFDNIKCVFFLAKLAEQNPKIQLTFDKYLKYLTVWNSLDDATKELYTIYSELENTSSS